MSKMQALYSDRFYKTKPLWMPSKLYAVVCGRANPKTSAQMLEIVKNRFNDLKLVDSVSHTDFSNNILLVYPDAIGLGNSNLELQLLLGGARAYIFNGRGRYFKLTVVRHLRLRMLRFFEQSFGLELLFLPFLLTLGVVCSLLDLRRTRNVSH